MAKKPEQREICPSLRVIYPPKRRWYVGKLTITEFDTIDLIRTEGASMNYMEVHSRLDIPIPEDMTLSSIVRQFYNMRKAGVLGVVWTDEIDYDHLRNIKEVSYMGPTMKGLYFYHDALGESFDPDEYRYEPYVSKDCNVYPGAAEGVA